MQGRKNSPAEAVYDRWTGFVSRIFSGMTVRERFLALAGLVLTAITAYYAAGKGIPFLPEGAGGGVSRPLGDALLCASGWTAPAAFLGLVYSAYRVGDGFVPRLAVLFILFGFRTAISAERGGKNGERWGFYRVKTAFYRERATVKIGVSAAFSLLTFGMRLPSVTLNAESLPELLSTLFITPALTALLCGAFDGRNAFDSVNHRVLYSVYKEISLFALPLLAVFAFGGHSFMGSSISAIAAVFLTVVTAVKGGTVRGAIMGALLGYTVSSVYAPVMTVVGIFAGILSGLGVGAAVGLACTAGCIVAVYAYGYKAFTFFISEGIIAAAVASPVVRYGFIGDGFPIPRKRIGVGGAAEVDADKIESRIRMTALGELSEAFDKLSREGFEKAERTRMPDAVAVCKRLKDGFCDSCPLVCICWDEHGHGNKTAFNAVKTRISQIYRDKKGADADSWVPPHFGCLRSSELMSEVIRICESDDIRARTDAAPPLGFFGDCRYISEILGELSDGGAESEYDAAMTEKLRRAIASVGLTADGAAIFGSRMKRAVIYGVSTDWGTAFKEMQERLAEAISKRCGMEFVPVGEGNGGHGADGGYGVETGKRRLVFATVPKLTVSYACVQSRATGEDENGDSAMKLETDDGYFYSAICDGMGSGTEAARCSENAVNTLKTLLRCRLSPALSAKLTGDAVKDGYDECFTTLDLFAVDLTTGEASVMKCGAADSYLIRNGEVRRLSLPTLPLGLAYGTVPEKIGLWLSDGDMMVTVSDGVIEEETEEDGSSERFSERLSELLHRSDGSAEDLAARILSAANGGRAEGARRDDMTVAVIKLGKR